jgi:NADH-quinone oxidoreductase subunit N
MNLSLLSHEWLVVGLGLAILLADLWVPAPQKRKLGYVAALGMVLVLIYSFLAFRTAPEQTQLAFGGMYVLDGLALFFKRFFVLVPFIVLLISIVFADFI